MGKSFIPLTVNGIPLKKAYNKIKKLPYDVDEASERWFFSQIPPLKDIKEIEVGDESTDEVLLLLKDGGFVKINTKKKLKELI
jgi:hypothetical protein